jgi:hypothetical protein
LHIAYHVIVINAFAIVGEAIFESDMSAKRKQAAHPSQEERGKNNR